MDTPYRLALAMLPILSFVASSLTANDAAKLPNHFAEVVLQVEGMT